MIGRLQGRLVESSPGRVILDVGGVGYEVQIPLSTFYELPAPAAGTAVLLHVHTHVRAEALQLFGFSRIDERRAFERLIAISGVGPKLALAILSGIGVSELAVAVHEGDRARIQRIPGVGKKTAERVLLELRDRLGFDEPVDPTAANGSVGADAPGVRSDALSALLNLGYARERALPAIDAAISESESEASLESVLRSTLRRLVGPA